MKAIANVLNHNGYRTKKGNLFTTNGVRDILHNPIYIGKIRFNVRENWAEKRRRGINKAPIIADGKHEAIIEQEVWDKVQSMIAAKSHRPVKIHSETFLLTGILKCPSCGAPMVAQYSTKRLKDGTKKVFRYYTCNNFKTKGSAACRSNLVNADKCESVFIKKLTQALQNERLIADTL